MKTRFLVALAGAALVASASLASAQNPRGTAEATVGTTSVSIEYGRPSLQGRSTGDLLAQAPAGTVWRLGADQSTTLTTSGDLHFGDTMVSAGSYSLFARRLEDGWTLLVNSQTGQWGTEHDPSQDIAQIPLTMHVASPQEMFTISIGGAAGEGMIHFEWGESLLMASFRTN